MTFRWDPSTSIVLGLGWKELLGLAVGLLIYLSFLPFLVLYVFPLSHNKSKRVAVLVLGDIGRSPRMQNHAVSLAKAGWEVDLIGFRGAELFADVLELKEKIAIRYLPATPKALTGGGKALFVVMGPLKVLFQIFSLIRLLFSIPQFSYILLQNPPSIPTIVVARFVCSFRSARLIIDWHNLGHTILALRLSPSHPLVRIHQLYEQVFSKCTYAHFCVTALMRQHLIQTYGLQNVIVLMDRPPERFSPFDEDAKAQFLKKLPETRWIDRNATKILVTSTSYTPDEPLHPLITALLKYSKTSISSLPKILLLITGKGPMKEQYRQIIEESSLSGKDPNTKCVAKMVWLEPDDYPRLLACADLGISLHTSSSGMDFPMKIVDLFGCGVPVCAIKFDAVGEVVEDGVNGVLFTSADDLYDTLINLLSDDTKLARLRSGVRDLKWQSWSEEWNQKAKPIFT